MTSNFPPLTNKNQAIAVNELFNPICTWRESIPMHLICKSIYLKIYTRCVHRRCSLRCGRNHRAELESRNRVRHHHRGSHAATCGLRCEGQPPSMRSHIWGEPVKNWFY